MILDDEPKREIALPGPKAEVNELLISAQYLYAKPEWRTVFPLGIDRGTLLAARHDLERCINTLSLIVGDREQAHENN